MHEDIKNVTASLRNRSILIVDDDESSGRAIYLVLKKFGFEKVHLVESGIDALNFLGLSTEPSDSPNTEIREEVELVILDVLLPDITGFEICDKVKKSILKSVPVILITGFEISEYIAQGVEVGADDFLSKPIMPEELVARVNILLQRKNTHEISELESPFSTESSVGGKQDKPYLGKKIDRYLIQDMLSWSASSIIYLVIDESTGKKVVLKKLLKQVLEFPDVIRRFDREIELLRSIDHPNICRYYDYGKSGGCPYCVLEYIEGKNLEPILKESGVLDFSTIYQIAEGLGKALYHLHQVGIIHRDIKLNNIFLTDKGHIKLNDLGVAIKVGETRLTQQGYAIGTPIYMSPEQFDGDVVDETSDIYSYGATLYHLITGQPPFTAENVVQLMNKHHQKIPETLQSLREDVPHGWNELIVERCLAKKIEDRPQSMSEVLESVNKLNQH